VEEGRWVGAELVCHHHCARYILGSLIFWLSSMG
jgi:hypothetical protein